MVEHMQGTHEALLLNPCTSKQASASLSRITELKQTFELNVKVLLNQNPFKVHLLHGMLR